MKSAYLTLTLILLLAVTITGQTPLQLGQMAFQGELRDAGGVPVVNGNYNMDFSIWDAATGGNMKWTESHSVPTIDGIFSVNLGSTTPLALDSLAIDGSDVVGKYLEISIGGETISPRIPLSSVPFAGVAQRLSGDVSTSPGTLTLKYDVGDSIHKISADSSGAYTVMRGGSPDVAHGEIMNSADSTMSVGGWRFNQPMSNRAAEVRSVANDSGATFIMRDTMPDKSGEIMFQADTAGAQTVMRGVSSDVAYGEIGSGIDGFGAQTVMRGVPTVDNLPSEIILQADTAGSVAVFKSTDAVNGNQWLFRITAGTPPELTGVSKGGPPPRITLVDSAGAAPDTILISPNELSMLSKSGSSIIIGCPDADGFALDVSSDRMSFVNMDSAYEGSFGYLGTVLMDQFGDSTTAMTREGFRFPDGTWQTTAATGGGGGGGFVDDGSIVRLESANDSVGIGTTSPSEKLDVVGNINASGSISSGNGLTMDGTSDEISSPNLVSLNFVGTALRGSDGITLNGSYPPLTTAALRIPMNYNDGAAGARMGIDGFVNNLVGGDAYGISLNAKSQDASAKGAALVGFSDYSAYGVNGIAAPKTSLGTSGIMYGVRGDASYGAYSYGVYGDAQNSSLTGFGVYGTASGSTTNYAGYFDGDVNVTGTLSKAGGSFKIDDPLDPANKYLQHSFVESPDMMNVYNGNVVTDDNGFSTVELPDYFDALNKDFRYQLTVIGTFAQAIIAEEIKDNQFVIQTDKPGVKVSWQVTGVRKDKWAEQNRIAVEVPKAEEDRGAYLHPKAFGLPPEMGIDYRIRQRHAAETVPGTVGN